MWNESFKCKTSDDVDQTIKIMIKNENRMLNDEIIGVSEISLGDCFQTGEDTIDAPVLNAKTRKRVGNIRVQCHSIERKYRRQRGKRGERKNGGGETEEDGYIDEREYDN